LDFWTPPQIFGAAHVCSKLLLKLKPIIPNRSLLTWIESFLSDRTQTVILNNSVSTAVNVTSGVPQGSVLGPTLFLLYINDIVDCIKHSQFTLFADDLKIFNTSDKQALLQQDLENLSFWAKTWQMSISLTKTNVLYLGNSNPKFRYSLDGVTLEDAGERCKDLGVLMSHSLSFSGHIQNIVSKGFKDICYVTQKFCLQKQGFISKGLHI